MLYLVAAQEMADASASLPAVLLDGRKDSAIDPAAAGEIWLFSAAFRLPSMNKRMAELAAISSKEMWCYCWREGKVNATKTSLIDAESGDKNWRMKT